MIKQGLVLAMALMLLNCRKDSAPILTGLQGRWVDVNSKTDTLIFESFGGQEALRLERGNEMRNGSLLPKFGSGIYTYKLPPGDKISLHWVASSSATFNDYYFRKAVEEITIGKFFDPPGAGTMLIFKKLQ